MRFHRRKGSYRSGFEKKARQYFDEAGIEYGYESHTITYTIPASTHKYTPDIVLRGGTDNPIYLEYKGRLDAQTRRKMFYVRQSNPDKDIRIVFQDANKTITKSSRTTYGQWATKNGFLWCDGRDGSIPQEWVG